MFARAAFQENDEARTQLKHNKKEAIG